VREIVPAACRETARRRFSADAMTERYLQLYELVAAGGWAA
jgi:hypothetical protein